MEFQVVIPVLISFAISVVLGPVIIPFLRSRGLCRGNALCAAALQVQNGAHALRFCGRHDPNGFRSVLRLRGLELPPLRLGELSVSPNNKKAFRDLLSVVERFFNIQGRFPAQYWRTTATTLPSTSHSRPSMGW